MLDFFFFLNTFLTNDVDWPDIFPVSLRRFIAYQSAMLYVNCNNKEMCASENRGISIGAREEEKNSQTKKKIPGASL